MLEAVTEAVTGAVTEGEMEEEMVVVTGVVEVVHQHMCICTNIQRGMQQRTSP